MYSCYHTYYIILYLGYFRSIIILFDNVLIYIQSDDIFDIFWVTQQQSTQLWNKNQVETGWPSGSQFVGPFSR